jgi:hypothetical protein
MLHPHVTPLCYTSAERRRPFGLDAVDQNKRAGFLAHNSLCTKDNHGANRERRRSVVDVLRV